MRAGELGHDEPAAAQVADKAAENGVGDAGHGRQHRRRGDLHRADRKLCGKDLHGDRCSDFIIEAALSIGKLKR